MAKNAIQRAEQQSPIIRIGELVQQSEGKIDTAGMEKLLEMHFRHEADEARKAFASDFTVVQSEIGAVVKNKFNPQTRSNYADLEGVIEMAKPVYTEHGFSIIYYEGETSVPEHIRVCADVLHKAGHKETYHYDVPMGGVGIAGTVNMTKIHAKATSVTYGRRYLLCMIWNIPTQDDDGNTQDDGNAAGKPSASVPPPNDHEQKVIRAICAAIAPPKGMMVDPKKVAAICYEKKQKYLQNIAGAPGAAKWFKDNNRTEIFIDVAKDEFDEFVEQVGDMPPAEAEATAAAKFGEENEIVECRFLCKACSNEYDNYKKIDQCPKCLTRDVIDRRPE